jgi:3-phenylpropionate/trans-cinnamate dioxygenase ferredoxin subunit
MLNSWTRINDLHFEDLPDGKIVEHSLGERRFSLLKKGENLFAFAATCPHAGARFCNGWQDAQGRIVCPEHKFRFDPANGRNTSGEGYKLRIFPTEIREGIIFIGL